MLKVLMGPAMTIYVRNLSYTKTTISLIAKILNCFQSIFNADIATLKIMTACSYL